MAKPNKILLHASSKGKSSSTKGHNGSFKNGHKSSPNNHAHSTRTQSSQSTSSHKSKESDKEYAVERFVREERDYRSHAVREFDAHQEAATTRHRDEIIGVVGRRYV
jgi:hypothetical protein